ncbi:MAG: YdcF family protein [Alicyclobacillus sp.]|nr:YdcF family protein [Alicyclobacillus sp.]
MLAGAVLFLAIWYGAALRIQRLGRRERPCPADVAIILGAYTDGFRPSATLQARLRTGLHLYRQGCVRFLLVSGGRGPDETVSEASAMKRFLILNGVPSNVIVEDRHSSDTWENLRNSHAVMARHGWRTAVVVTSDYHLPRALAVARRLGMEVSGCAARSPKGDWRYAWREVAAYLKYALAGQASWTGGRG